MKKLLTIAECRRIVKERGGKIRSHIAAGAFMPNQWVWQITCIANGHHVGLPLATRFNSKRAAYNDAARFAMEHLKKPSKKR